MTTCMRASWRAQPLAQVLGLLHGQALVVRQDHELASRPACPGSRRQWIAFSGLMILPPYAACSRTSTCRPGPHGGAHRAARDVDALAPPRAWPRAPRRCTAVQFSTSACSAERKLAERHHDVAVPVHAELDPAGLELLHRGGRVVGHRAGLRVRHQAARARAPCPACALPSWPPGVATATSKSVQPPWTFSIRSSKPDVDPRPASRAASAAAPGGEHQHADLLARAVRQRHRAAHRLVRLASGPRPAGRPAPRSRRTWPPGCPSETSMASSSSIDRRCGPPSLSTVRVFLAVLAIDPTPPRCPCCGPCPR